MCYTLCWLISKGLYFFFFLAILQNVGSWFPDQGSNLCPLHCKSGVLTTGPLGKSQWVSTILCILQTRKQKLGVLKQPAQFFFLKGWVLVTCPVLSSVSSVQLLSHVLLFATPWIAAHQASLSITNSRSSLKLMSIESVILGDKKCNRIFLQSLHSA